MRCRPLLCFIFAFFFLATAANAQVSTGTPPLGSFSSGPDVINLGNLNMHFGIPVFSKPGRGIPFNYTISFDNSIWAPVSTGWTPVVNWGWRGVSEASTGYISAIPTNENCGLISVGAASGTVTTSVRYVGFQYHDAYGVIHSGFTNESGGCPGDGQINTSVSTDISGYTLNTTTKGSWFVLTPTGELIYPAVGPNASGGSVIDRNGNKVSNDGKIFTDTLGLTALTVTGGAPNPLIYTYTTSSGTPASVTVNYTSQTVQTNFQCGIPEYGPQAVNLVSSVTLPDGSSYSFTYEPTPSRPGSVTGRIHVITLPTGGTITYNYTGGNDSIECSDGTTAGFDRVTSDGTVSYTRSGSLSNWGTSVLDASPVRNKTVINFQSVNGNFYETHRTVNQGSSTILLQTDTCYNSAVWPNCGSTDITLPITELKRYTTLPNGQESLTDTLMTSLGLPTEVDEYDFGSSPHGALLRKTITSYAPLTGVAGLPHQITVQDGSGNQTAQTTFTYDEGTPAGPTSAPQHVAPPGARGNLTTLAQWVSSTATLVTTFTYDDTGNVLTSKDPFNNVTNYSYQDRFHDGINRSTLAYLTQTTLPPTGSPPVAHITQSEYDHNTGLPTTAWDLNGNPTTYTYDELQRALQINPPTPDGGQTSFVYNSPTSITTNQVINPSQTVSVTSILDGLGRISHQQLTSDPAGTDFVDTVYDSNGRVLSVSNPHRAASSPTDGITQFAYDALGRIVTQTQPDGNTIQNNYTNNCLTITDEAAKARENCSDALGRVTSTFEPDSTSSLNWETDAAYDALNNVVSITQKGGSTVAAQWRTTTASYDGLSRTTQVVAPESGTTNYFYTTSTGLLCAGSPSVQCRVTDARGITRTYAYDALNRMTGKTYSATTPPTPAVTYSYDQGTNGNGMRTGMSDGSGSTAWTFDKMGRVLTRQQTIATATKSISYTYNQDGTVQTIKYPSGKVYTYTYNNADQITSLVDATHNFFSNAQYAPPGLLTGALHGATTGWNAITLANTFNNRLQPTELKATSPVPLTLLDLAYSYDQGSGKNNGNVAQITNGRDNTRTVAYTYDQVNRLSTAQTPFANTWGNSYVYDPWGNLYQKNVIKGSGEDLTATVSNNQNHFDLPYTYDAAGNMLFDTVNTMTYDAEGHITSAAGATYTYDGDGRRVEKSDGTLYWFDDNSRVLSLGTTSGSLTKDFVFLGDKRIAFVSLSNGNPYYYLSDQLGSTSVISSGDGKVIEWDADYFPFGNERQVFTSLVNNPYQFTGYEYDSATGFNYANARYEAGKLSRFMSPDPYLGSMDLTNPQSLNRYAYVMNRPLTLNDPSGLDPADCSDPDVQCDSGEIQPLSPDECAANPFCVIVFVGPPIPIGNSTPASLFPGDGFLDPPPIQPLGFNVDPNDGHKVLPCFVKGLKHGAVGAVAVAAVTAVAGAVLAPEVVTAGLFVAAAAGTALLASSAVNHILNGNSAGLAYDAGSAIGGLAVGGATGFGVRNAITGETNLPSSFSDFLGAAKRVQFNRPGQNVLGALRAAFSKGPDLGGAALAVGTAGAGAASGSGCN